ncbi:MAG: molecular chaperone DnaK [Myxococcota bacterium]
MSEIAVGIDLGTSNSCVAIVRDGQVVEVLSNAYGEHTTASVVAFAGDGAITVGNAAKANIIHDPQNTISSAKRLIGRYFFSEEVKKAQAICAYEIIEADNHGVRIQVRDESFSLPEISAMVLREMKQIAEARLGEPVTKAVITVPAYFNDNQRQATKDAGRIAGLEVLRILNEPTAAALAYGFGKGLNQKVAVYDLGGGTFDVSVLEIGKDIFEVLSTCGDTFLGGDDFDDRIIDLLADEFMGKEGINLRDDAFAFEKLKVAAESAKKGLSEEDEVEIRIPDVITGEDGRTRSIERKVTATEFSALVNDLIQRTFKVCDEAMQQADLTVRDLDGIILVGGPTRLPVIREAVTAYFQKDANREVDPDEVVAMGAAIHASSLVNQDQESFLLDVTPLDLRIGVAGGLAEPVIERNTPVPIEQSRRFTTYQDHQESVKIRVYQGDSRQAEENELLGQFEFAGFRKAPRGEVTIEVTFEINTDGIVNVTATDLETGEATSAAITLSSGLSEEELADIIEENPTERVATAPESEPAAAAAQAPPAAPATAPDGAGGDDLELLGDDEDLDLLDDGELVALAEDGGELELDEIIETSDDPNGISVRDLGGDPEEVVPIEGREPAAAAAPGSDPEASARPPASSGDDVRDELFDSTPTNLSGDED